MKDEIIKIGKKLGLLGFTPGVSGNISQRTDNGFFITASGTKLSELEQSDIVGLDFKGNIFDGNKKPSSEKNLHKKIYEMRDDVNAIIHCHSPKCTTLSVCHIAMDKKFLADCIFYFNEIPLAEYGMPSSDTLVNNTAPYFKNHNVVLLANHGLVVAAGTIENALNLVETAEFNAEVYINALMLNMAKPLSNKDVSEILKLKR